MISIRHNKLIALSSCILFDSSALKSLPIYCSLSSLEVLNPIHTPVDRFQSVSKKHLFVIDYLTKTFGVSTTKLLSSLRQVPQIHSSERPNVGIKLLREFEFSEASIRKSVQNCPQIIFMDTENILKPKLQFFRELGLTGPQLGLFVSTGPSLLTYSLERRIIPSVDALSRLLSGENLIRAIRRCKWVISADPSKKLLPNISFLRDKCGIDGHQLTMLLVREPGLLVMNPTSLRDRAQKVAEMGFTADSQMFVYALYTICCMNAKTFRKKLDLFRSYDFSEEELTSMIRKAPSLLRTSKEKLISGLEFFLKKVGIRSDLIRYPASLMYSMERRIAPRYRVFEILDSKKLLKEGTMLVRVIQLTEEEFLRKYILRFEDEASNLLEVYNLGISPAI